MKNSIKSFLMPKKIFLICTLFLFQLLIIESCTGIKFVPYATFFSFEYDGDKYRIRSVFLSGDQQSFNELIGKGFVARDFDKDGILDKVVLGQRSLPQVQTIYEFALDELTKQGKLRRIADDSQFYSFANTKFNYEIRSFRSDGNQFFNVLKISGLRQFSSTEIAVGIDHKADGSIDEIVKGTMTTNEMQNLYTMAIQKGLFRNKLIEFDNMIVVK
jgi:hypothetical protein